MSKPSTAPAPPGKRKAAAPAAAGAATTLAAAADGAAANSGARLKRGTTAVDLRIYRAVVNAVMSHRLPPGTHLGEADFCELYRVSRTTVRKALQRLAHDHIIELRPNRGAVIASPTPEQARDIFAARRALEREIVPLVIRHRTPASLQQIRQALEAEDQARRTGDRASWIRLGGEFHLLLAELAGNQVLLRFMGELVSRCSLIIALYESPGASMCENDEHKELMALIEQGKAEQAGALIEHHLLEIEGRLRLGEPGRKINLAEALAGL
ncbi:GntR family transcriptional regulator [Rugamonas sp. DEMB1]|uniref:GntR family transcriptional regulator n=1 Tax=Rugamonas sp. DEMB1 TaxID=3039386 RepID=UPI0024472BF6|nr:GntR family transcriptional regulator [Rugamonas sp. DEMB1]WGG50303.1 GntR family transcriptional regulator [Rugamonas sp. DEMB1]